MSNVLSETVSNRMSELMFEMTHKDYKNVKAETLKELQTICKDSNVRIERVYSLLMDYLKKPHSELRYNAFYIFNDFFKSHRRFRELAVGELKCILDMITDINSSTVLPPPKAAANELKRFFLKSVKEWVQEFGPSYMKLKLCYEFLLRKKNVDFEKLEMEDRASWQRKEEERKKKEQLAEKKLKYLRCEMSDLKPEMLNVRKSLESCLNMLIPTPEEFFINHDAGTEISGTSQANLSNYDVENMDVSENVETNENGAAFRETGMLPGSYSVNINLPKEDKRIKITETEENAIIIENAKDYYKLLNRKYITVVRNWIRNLTTLSGSSKELKEAIDLKVQLQNIISKYEHLSFEKVALSSENENDSDPDDMEDVTPYIPTADEEIIANLKNQSAEMPSTSNSDFQNSNTDNSSLCGTFERKRKLLEVAPKLPFDVDLYYWEEENLSTPVLLPVQAEGRQFWSASALEDSEGLPVPDGAAVLRTRTIEFTGKFEPVKWSCRFPLSSGKLCPRQDRFKCPFHGKIVPRDATGKCANPEDAKKDKEMASKINYSDAQNPELLAEIKIATGIDLKLPEKFKRRKKDDSSLTNIKKEEDTARRRLEKKLFKRSTVKKVARTLDAMDQKRFRDKFGDQFQYVHGTT